MFEVVFDYEEDTTGKIRRMARTAYSPRLRSCLPLDHAGLFGRIVSPSYRVGFEVRTYRRCRARSCSIISRTNWA